MNKRDFPILKKYPDLAYLDNAASTQKPQQVIDAVTNFYETSYANIHRGIYDLSQQATELYENVRKKTADFICADDPSEIVFTSSATESLNLIARGWAKQHLQKGDIIVLSEMEHHSNIVPWLKLKQEIGIEIIYLPVTNDYRLDYTSLHILDNKNRIKLVSLTHASNVLGTINPIKSIIASFKAHGINAVFVVDAAQSIPHLSIDVRDLDCDFLAFSSHKMIGPSGVGVLWGRKKRLEETEPQMLGGHMIKIVTEEQATWAEIPDRFEGGTRNIEGVIGFGSAIDYLQNFGMDKLKKDEAELTTYALKKLTAIPELKLYGPTDATDRLGVFSFILETIHPHDIAEILNRNHVAIRSGHHCTQLLMQKFCVLGTARASLYFYNTKDDINKLIEGIEETKKIFSRKNI